MKTLRFVLAAAAVLFTPALARAQAKPAEVPALGAPGFLALGLVLGIAGLVGLRRRR
jgi:hypothetical protein